MAVHAGPRRREVHDGRRLNRGVTVPAIETKLADVELMAVRDRLNGTVADVGVPRRKVVPDARGGECRTENDHDSRHDRKFVPPRGKNLGQRLRLRGAGGQLPRTTSPPGPLMPIRASQKRFVGGTEKLSIRARQSYPRTGTRCQARCAGNCGRRGRLLWRRDDRRLLDEVELRKLLLQVAVSLAQDPPLIRLVFASGTKQFVHDLHAGDDLPEWRKALLVEITVVRVVDEDLGDARVRQALLRKGHVAARVALHRRLVAQAGPLPGGLSVRVAVQTELRHESRAHPEEAGAVVKAVLHQVVEAARANRRPFAMRLDHVRPFAALEARAKNVGRGFGQLRRISQFAALRGHAEGRGEDQHERPTQAVGSLSRRSLAKADSYARPANSRVSV